VEPVDEGESANIRFALLYSTLLHSPPLYSTLLCDGRTVQLSACYIEAEQGDGKMRRREKIGGRQEEWILHDENEGGGGEGEVE
jgi:hypothetical protein